jgi:hypothetical protein
MLLLGEGVARNDREGIDWIRFAAERGSANAQALYGSIYQHGTRVPKDYVLAARWLKPAAIAGVSDAQFELGWAYMTGSGVQKDLRRGYAWETLSATRGYEFAKKTLPQNAVYLTRDQIRQAKAAAASWRVGKDIELAPEPPGYVGLGVFNVNAPFLPGN